MIGSGPRDKASNRRRSEEEDRTSEVVLSFSLRTEDIIPALSQVRALLPPGTVLTVRQHGDSPDPAPMLEALTPRQREILALLPEKRSNKVIARRLNLSPYTVRNHVCQILQALNVADRQTAADLYLASMSSPPPDEPAPNGRPCDTEDRNPPGGGA